MALNNEDVFVKIWPFEYAPEKYKKLSYHGGDEDWVIEYPKDPSFFQLSYFENIADRLTVCDYQEIEVDGVTVIITSHA